MQHRSDLTRISVIPAGTVVGLLTGFFGVGGGFVIVPALVLALGFTMPEAVGTSLLVITINSMVALSTRLEAGSIEWGTVIPFTLASLLGVVIGTRLARTKDSTSLAALVRRPARRRRHLPPCNPALPCCEPHRPRPAIPGGV